MSSKYDTVIFVIIYTVIPKYFNYVACEVRGDGVIQNTYKIHVFKILINN